MISSRVTDVRAAQSMAGISVLPIAGLASWILMKQIHLGLSFALIAALVLVVFNTCLLWLAVKTFSRESILLRWK